VWSLPPDTSCDLLYILSDSIPTYDELCRRFIGFVYSCIHCGSDFVSFVVRHGIFYSRMSSPIGRNSIFCSVRFNVPLVDLILCKLPFEFFVTRFTSRLNPELVESAVSVFEMIRIRDGYLSLPGQFFSREDINLLIKSIVSDVT